GWPEALDHRPPVFLPHQLHHLLAELSFMSTMRRPSRTAMPQTCGAFVSIALPQPFRLPKANLHQSTGVHDSQLLAPNPRQHFHPSQFLLAHLCPPQSDLLSEVYRGTFLSRRKGDIFIEAQQKRACGTGPLHHQAILSLLRDAWHCTLACRLGASQLPRHKSKAPKKKKRVQEPTRMVSRSAKVAVTKRDRAAGEWFAKLVALQTRLRGPNGCPWDGEQTHESLRKFLIEEAYEVLDAMESGDEKKFASELGDLLLQVIFHSILAEETERFTISDVIESVHTKMSRRHPHVFGDVAA